LGLTRITPEELLLGAFKEAYVPPPTPFGFLLMSNSLFCWRRFDTEW